MIQSIYNTISWLSLERSKRDTAVKYFWVAEFSILEGMQEDEGLGLNLLTLNLK
jgi:hypothetical protein